MSRTLVFGASGQVGSALLKLLGDFGMGADLAQADFAHPESLISILEQVNPSAIINAAAYTLVEQAESEEESATIVNADAPGTIARWCAGRGIPFVHYSTDYVFSGKGTQPWTEENLTAPVNAYGRSKLAGERLVSMAGGKYLIFRTSWIYDGKGKNFLNTMLKLARERERIAVVSDQIGGPTYAPDLAKATLDALAKASQTEPFPSGVYHLCGGGETSWHGFATEIFALAKKKKIPLKVKEVLPITSLEYPAPATRPLNSRLSSEKAKRVLGISLPDWKDALKRCMTENQWK